MIKNKIVFVLGAGASKPFMFPLGYELLEIICKSLKYEPETQMEYPNSSVFPYETPIEDDTRSKNPLFQMLIDYGFDKNYIESFSGSLFNSQIGSVDAFLEYRTEFIEIGKMCIVYNLLRHELHYPIFNNADWYKYVWNKMLCPFEDFDKNEISFITFNYDRSLEYFLITSMRALYGKTPIECYKKLIKIPIIHLHGKLGDLPWENIGSSVEFGETVKDSQRLAKVSNAIRIIHEDVQDDAIFNRAKELLSTARQVYLLGFGFNKKNIERLSLNEIKRVSGTSLGFTPLERDKIKSDNPNFFLDPYGHDCLNFLRETIQIS